MTKQTAMKYVFHFEQGDASQKNLLGGKGANLAEMTNVGLPVPPGFTITTEACRTYYAIQQQFPEGLQEEIQSAMSILQQKKKQRFGDVHDPLLVSVRSGSVSSMPGMMDTILNLGLNDETVQGLARITQNERFAYDCYRRLIQMFGTVVFGIEHIFFEQKLHHLKTESHIEQDRELTADHWKQLISQYKELITHQTKQSFPQEVNQQLELAVNAVFASWNNKRAIIYRKINRISDEQGTAVNIQSMVFGNMGDDCGTGVCFTRNPSTGDKGLYGEFLVNAQGEDVVAGIRTPIAIAELYKEMPAIFQQLVSTAELLETHYQDMQDIEFTIEKNTLYLLQTRNGKRTAQAAMKIAADLVNEHLITKEQAIQRIDTSHLDQLLHSAIDDQETLDVIAIGLPASPGAVSGRIVFDPDRAEEWHAQGQKVILVSTETTPEDIHGVIAAEGVLTSRGGMTSHAAVVARGMGKSCVCGCESIHISSDSFTAGDRIFSEGDWISLDGATGKVIAGQVKLIEPRLTDECMLILKWADEIRHLKVMANADNGHDAKTARLFGAEGIGLCRTEHMFMQAERLHIMQHMILADHIEERQAALNQLLPFQQRDFEEMFREMAGLPVTIRLLDPPLHEFLPQLQDLLKKQQTLQEEQLTHTAEAHAIHKMIRQVRALHEANPMLGQRGCRLGIVFPEIYEMQIKAIFYAVKSCRQSHIEVIPEIMIPLVGHVNELKILRETVDRLALDIFSNSSELTPYRVGTMIEVPRAALVADQISEHADFFSFGTNDLTQMTFGYSRDDAEGKFLTHYVDHKILPANPFQHLDTEGVGALIEIAVHRGQSVKPQLKKGICGEHGGDPASIAFCHQAGLDYVSCSPYRVPLARLAAAQAKLAEKK
jgi:pyruvate,orthophosphate dikinase